MSSGPAGARRAATLLLASLCVALLAAGSAGAAPLNPTSGTVDLAELTDVGTSLTLIRAWGPAMSAALLGDVNGDGIGDYAIGVPTADPRRRKDAGSVYVVFGRRGADVPVDLAALGDRGYRIDGAVPDARVGTSIVALGKVDGAGDTLADFAIGGPGATGIGGKAVGIVYIMRGANSPPVNADLRLSARDPRIVALLGIDAGDETGWALAALPPASRDGPGGLIIGARFANPGGRLNAGSAYVLPGPLPATGAPSLSTLAPTSYRINGVTAGDQAGYAVATSPDMNGDLVPEVLVASAAASVLGPQGGAAYVVPNRPIGGSVELAAAGAASMTMYGTAGRWLGSSLLGPGDISGDGVPDVVVGAPYAPATDAERGGSVFVVRGQPSSPLPIALPGTPDGALALNGVMPGDRFGRRLAPSGDLDGDGIAEVLVSATRADAFARADSGAVYVLRGRDLRSGLFSLALLGRSGVRLAGTAPRELGGNGLAGGLDADGGGRADILVAGNTSAQLLDAPHLPDPAPSISTTNSAGCVVTRDIELLVDDGPSMRSGDPQLVRQAAIEQMLSKPRDAPVKLGAIEFGSSAAEVFPPVTVDPAGFKDGRELASLSGLLAEHIRNDAGKTDYATGILAGVLHNPTAGALLLITDGSGPPSPAPLPNPGRRVYVLPLGGGRADAAQRLRELANATGGHFFEEVDAESLPAALALMEGGLRCEEKLTTQVEPSATQAPSGGEPPAPQAPSPANQAIATATVTVRKPARFVTGLPAATPAATLIMSFPHLEPKRAKVLKNGRLAGTRASRCYDNALVHVRSLRVFHRRRVALRATARQLRLAFTGHPTRIGTLYALGRCGPGYLTLRITGLQRVISRAAGAQAARDTPTRYVDISTKLNRGRKGKSVKTAWTADKKKAKKEGSRGR